MKFNQTIHKNSLLPNSKDTSSSLQSPISLCCLLTGSYEIRKALDEQNAEFLHVNYVHTVASVLQMVNIWILLSSELPNHAVWYTTTIEGNPDVSILRPENGGTRFLGMCVTTYQPTYWDNQKTTVFTINRCKNLTVFLGDCENQAFRRLYASIIRI